MQGAWQFPVSVSHPSRAAGTEQTMPRAGHTHSPVTAQVWHVAWKLEVVRSKCRSGVGSGWTWGSPPGAPVPACPRVAGRARGQAGRQLYTCTYPGRVGGGSGLTASHTPSCWWRERGEGSWHGARMCKRECVRGVWGVRGSARVESVRESRDYDWRSKVLA